MNTFKETASVIKGCASENPRRLIQIVTSGALGAVGAFNSRRKGKDYGEVHVFSIANDGSWKFMRTFEASCDPEGPRRYWTDVEITVIEYEGYEGTQQPILRITQSNHRKSDAATYALPVVEIVI